MRNPARRQRGGIAHSLDMPALTRVPLGPYTLLPVVVGGGPRYGALVGGMYWAMLFLLAAVYACTLPGVTLLRE